MPANGRQLGRRTGRLFLFFGPDLVHEPQQSLVLSSPLHQVSGTFQRSASTDLVHKSQQNLVPSFPLHQVSGPFQRSAGTDLVHRPPQGPVLSFPLHQVPRPFRRSAGADLVHKPPQSLIPSFPLHQVSGPFQQSAGTRWRVSDRRLESRKGEWPRPFSFSSFPQSKASGGTPEAHELLFLCSISIQSISIS